jgi:hypothetical protein
MACPGVRLPNFMQTMCYQAYAGRMDQLLTFWMRLAGNTPETGHAYNYLRAALRALLPNDEGAAGVALLDGAPAVLVVSGNGLFTATVPLDGGDGPVPVSLRRLPLASDRVMVELVEDLDGQTNEGGGRACSPVEVHLVRRSDSGVRVCRGVSQRLARQRQLSGTGSSGFDRGSRLGYPASRDVS